MLKAFLDAVKGKHGLINDDMEIIHLEAFKVINHAGMALKIPSGLTVQPAFTSHETMILARLINATETLAM